MSEARDSAVRSVRRALQAGEDSKKAADEALSEYHKQRAVRDSFKNDLRKEAEAAIGQLRGPRGPLRNATSSYRFSKNDEVQVAYRLPNYTISFAGREYVVRSDSRKDVVLAAFLLYLGCSKDLLDRAVWL